MNLLIFFFWFDDSNLHYTHAHTVWGGQGGFEPLPNGREFSLAPLGQMPSGHPLNINSLKNDIWFEILSSIIFRDFTN